MTKMLSQMHFVLFKTQRPKKLPAILHQFLDVTKRFVTSKNWCWIAGNFFGHSVMNKTKIICDSILVIDNGKLSEILAH